MTLYVLRGKNDNELMFSPYDEKTVGLLVWETPEAAMRWAIEKNELDSWPEQLNPAEFKWVKTDMHNRFGYVLYIHIMD